MRFLRALKSTPRFLVLAPAFGVLVALIVMAQSPSTARAQPGTSGGVIQYFEDYTCAKITCDEIYIAPLVLACDGGDCKLDTTYPAKTCRKLTEKTNMICTNSDDAYGHIRCSGKCALMTNVYCGLDVYNCSKGP